MSAKLNQLPMPDNTSLQTDQEQIVSIMEKHLSNADLSNEPSIYKCMEEYASYKNEQLRKALEAQGTYLSFLTHHYRALFEFARVHGYEANEKDVRQGEALRNQMSITQQALTPQP
jgi:hypothetical protein